ncbi:hypothetical protein E2C01_003283 [Portunus trituberculatus]|uniref:Uncharacterized protein n=1 Tax=Portunus trituberculatus TaxID=210409 RepID=A0A5B7CPT3_PORTR|nr:hypothetical protein [Portunus trituberculatus]
MMLHPTFRARHSRPDIRNPLPDRRCPASLPHVPHAVSRKEAGLVGQWVRQVFTSQSATAARGDDSVRDTPRRLIAPSWSCFINAQVVAAYSLHLKSCINSVHR